MKRIRLIILLLFGFLFTVQVQAQARSYEIANYNVLVEIQDDGSAFFTESITYDFEGDFNGVLYDLDISGVQTPTDVAVLMQSKADGEVIPFDLSDSGASGTFTLVNTGDFLNFTVYNKMSNEKQTVIYRYRIPEIVTNYNDTAEFDRAVVGGGWKDVLNDVDVTVILPTATGDNELRTWGHGGGANSTVTIVDNQRVLLHVPQNPANQLVEAHIIFPISITPNNFNVVNEDKYESILAQEAALAEPEREIIVINEDKHEDEEILAQVTALAEQGQKNKELLWIVLGVLGLIASILVAIWIYRLRKRDE